MLTLHIVHHVVAPNFCSVDGSNARAFVMSKIFPLLIPNVAILMASSMQSLQPEIKTEKHSETLLIKSNVLATINNLLQQDFASVARQALSAVVHLTIVEVSLCIPLSGIAERLNELSSGGGEIQRAYGHT
jgi:hypothetical protein